MIRLISTTLLLGLAFGASSAQAASFNSLNALSQDQFEQMSENMAAAIQYKGITPAEPLGILGFDVGLSVSYTSIEVDEIFDAASDGDFDVAGIALPRLTFHKGLPFGFDVGASFTGAPGTDIKVMGAEVRYAFVSGNIALPAVGVRASGSVLQGVDEMDMQNVSLDISVSKGFLMVTPYAGIGVVRTTATPNDAENLEEATLSQTKLFGGVNVNLGLLNLTFEADKTGDYSTGSLKAGFRF